MTIDKPGPPVDMRRQGELVTQSELEHCAFNPLSALLLEALPACGPVDPGS